MSYHFGKQEKEKLAEPVKTLNILPFFLVKPIVVKRKADSM